MLDGETKVKGVMDIMDPSGHTRTTWDSENPHEVEMARETFNKMTGEKRYRAFRVKKDGSEGEIMREFDPSAEKMILAPPLVGG